MAYFQWGPYNKYKQTLNRERKTNQTIDNNAGTIKLKTYKCLTKFPKEI